MAKGGKRRVERTIFRGEGWKEKSESKMASSSGSQFNFTLPIEALSEQNANVLSAILGMQQQGEDIQSMGKVTFN